MAHAFAADRDARAGPNGEMNAVGTLTISSYTAAGEVLAASDFATGGTLKDVNVHDAISSNGYICRFDRATLKMRVYAPVKLIHNATPSAQAVSVTAADNGLEANFGADTVLPGQEVPSTTNVGTVRVTAIAAI